MSKASEWGKLHSAARGRPKFEFSDGDYEVDADVSDPDDDGSVGLSLSVVDADDRDSIMTTLMRTDDALCFAHWIIDTFGEQKAGAV